MNKSLNFKNVLDIILKTTKKKVSILADMYLFKGVSMVYKWNNMIVTPSDEDINRIVEFTVKESSEIQKRIIRDSLEKLIIDSFISEDIKNEIIGIRSFDEFIYEVLNISTEEDYCEEAEESVNVKVNDSGGIVDHIIMDQDLSGKYSGVVTFDLNLKKSSTGKSNNEIYIKEKNLNKRFINKLGKYGTTIVILAFISTLFVRALAYNNKDDINQPKIKISSASEKVSCTTLIESKGLSENNKRLDKSTTDSNVIENNQTVTLTETDSFKDDGYSENVIDNDYIESINSQDKNSKNTTESTITEKSNTKDSISEIKSSNKIEHDKNKEIKDNIIDSYNGTKGSNSIDSNNKTNTYNANESDNSIDTNKAIDSNNETNVTNTTDGYNTSDSNKTINNIKVITNNNISVSGDNDTVISIKGENNNINIYK